MTRAARGFTRRRGGRVQRPTWGRLRPPALALPRASLPCTYRSARQRLCRERRGSWLSLRGPHAMFDRWFEPLRARANLCAAAGRLSPAVRRACAADTLRAQNPMSANFETLESERHELRMAHTPCRMAHAGAPRVPESKEARACVRQIRPAARAITVLGCPAKARAQALRVAFIRLRVTWQACTA